MRVRSIAAASSAVACMAIVAAVVGDGRRIDARSDAPPPLTSAPQSAPLPPLPQSGGVNDSAPQRPHSNIPLSNGELRQTVDNLVRSRPGVPGVLAPDQFTRVEVIHSLPASQMKDAITALGGAIEGEAEGLVQASVPTGQLVALEREPGVLYIRPPLRVNIPLSGGMPDLGAPPSRVDRAPLTSHVVGQEVAKTNAAAWQAAGVTGAGVKVGIVDFFGETPWNAAQTAGEVPAPAGTFCQFNGSACSTFDCGGQPCTIFNIDPTVQHGTAVAEIIHEMAPGVQIYLAFVFSTADLQAAVNYFAAQGVKIISRSLTSEYDGPGNGTGPIANVVDSAVAQGTTWFNSAGNSAGPSPFAANLGQYWRGSWVDANGNGWLDFAPGDEFLGFVCGYMNGLRWSDWGANPTDYDLYIYSSVTPLVLAHTSLNDQATGSPPIEFNQLACDGTVYYAAVHRFNAGGGTAGDVLEIMTNGGALERWQTPFSASGPVSDSASSGELTVGAIDPALGTQIALYSSQGPTNDSRIKPDLSAAACVASFTYAPDCFNGTSSAAPVAAGAAALVLRAGLAATPAEVKVYLLNSATVDRGAPGTDNAYGRGELILPLAALTVDTDGDGCPDVTEIANQGVKEPDNPLDHKDFPEISGDGKVSLPDVIRLALIWNQLPGDPGWDADTDANGIADGVDRDVSRDGKISLPDVITMALAWNRTCP